MPCLDCAEESGSETWSFKLFTAFSHLQGKICQFPFIFDGITYTSCTRAGNATKPWCSTKVDQFNNHISSEDTIIWLKLFLKTPRTLPLGFGEFSHCTASCPDDSGYPASGSGPACQVRTTGNGYTDQCSDQLNKSNKNILFIGNSYTYDNDLPGMVKSLAAAAGLILDDDFW